MNKLTKEIHSILINKDKYLETFEISKLQNGYEISYGCQYEAPEISFKTLKQLSELFGTDSIDVDDWGHSGCPTCDWGSEYGHRIQIYKVTKNLEELEELVGKTLLPI